MPKKDFTQVAHDTFLRSIGEQEAPAPKDAAAAEMGRKGGKARKAKLTPEQRHEIAKRAALARWEKEKRDKAG